jgi:hypothetical protein
MWACSISSGRLVLKVFEVMEGLSVVTFKLTSVVAILIISLLGSFLPLKLRAVSAEKRVS